MMADTLLDIVMTEIMKTQGQFAADDFYHLADERKMHRCVVSKALKKLRTKEMIIARGHRFPCVPPCRDLVVYEVIPGAVFEKAKVGRKPITKQAKAVKPKKMKADSDYRRMECDVEKQRNMGALRLEAAMSAWR